MNSATRRRRGARGTALTTRPSLMPEKPSSTSSTTVTRTSTAKTRPTLPSIFRRFSNRWVLIHWAGNASGNHSKSDVYASGLDLINLGQVCICHQDPGPTRTRFFCCFFHFFAGAHSFRLWYSVVPIFFYRLRRFNAISFAPACSNRF
jgi:hypothetical protein